MKRRTLLARLLVGTLGVHLMASAASPVVGVYKSAACGCCSEWVNHLQSNGFTVNVHNVANPSDYREKLGIPNELGSCHTAAVQGYAIEGHVPASDIKRLLVERPMAKGLAVPSMPPGSSGMDEPQKMPYDVLMVESKGQYAVYKHYN